MGKLIYVIVAFWYLFILNTHLTGNMFLFPTIQTEYVLFFFVVSLLLGSLIYWNFNNLFNSPKKHVISDRGWVILRSIVGIYFACLVLIAARIIVYKFLIGHELSRVEIFSPSSFETGTIWAAIYVLIVYLKSITSVIVSYVCLRSLLHRDYKMLVIILSMIIFETIIFLAKGPIIGLLFILVVWTVIDKNSPLKLILKHWKIVIPFGVVSIILVTMRHNNIGEIAIAYFSIGPVLLSNVVDETYGSPLLGHAVNDFWLIFSGLEYLITIALRFVWDPSYVSTGYMWIKMTDIPLIAQQSGIKFMPYNAFFTLLAEPYLALGMFGITLLGVITGYMLSAKEQLVVFYRCDLSLFILYYISFILYEGVFVSPFGSVTFWILIFLLIIFKNQVFERQHP